jgi:hypothetical protein
MQAAGAVSRRLLYLSRRAADGGGIEGKRMESGGIRKLLLSRDLRQKSGTINYLARHRRSRSTPAASTILAALESAWKFRLRTVSRRARHSSRGSTNLRS